MRHGRSGPSRPSGRDVDSLIEYATGEQKGNFDEVAVVAGRLMELGRERDDRKASLYGLIYPDMRWRAKSAIR